MAARVTLAALITQIRAMIEDPAATPVFSDDQIQVYLDEQRSEARYLPLAYLETRQSGGSIVYLTYVAPVGWWEGGVSLVDTNYDALTPATSDLQVGRWTFAAHTQPPVYLTGFCYDIYSAAVAILTAWLAKLKLAMDFSADGASFKLSQRAANLRALIADYQAKQGQGGLTMGTMVRSDLNTVGW
jgi:hypothetical protein